MGLVQSTESNWTPGSIEIGPDHDEPFQLSTPPLSSPAIQNRELVHDREIKSYVSDPTGVGAVHEEPFQVSSAPPLPPATQNVALGHDTANRSPSLIMSGADHDEPLYVRALPSRSTAAQNNELAHDTATTAFEPSTFIGADQSVSLAAATPGVTAARTIAVEATKTVTRVIRTTAPNFEAAPNRVDELRLANFILPPRPISAPLDNPQTEAT